MDWLGGRCRCCVVIKFRAGRRTRFRSLSRGLSIFFLLPKEAMKNNLTVMHLPLIDLPHRSILRKALLTSHGVLTVEHALVNGPFGLGTESVIVKICISRLEARLLLLMLHKTNSTFLFFVCKNQISNG